MIVVLVALAVSVSVVVIFASFCASIDEAQKRIDERQDQ